MWVRIGVGEIIPGLDEAIIGMEAGEKKTVTVPPKRLTECRTQSS